MNFMGAIKKKVSQDGMPRTVEYNNGATKAMFSTNSKKALAKKQNQRVLRRKFEKRNRHLSTFRAIVIAFILGILCVGQYGIIQDMGLTINSKQATLNNVTAENEALKQKIAAMSNRNEIRKRAEKELGMIEAQSTIVYAPSTPVSKQDMNE